MLSRVCYKSKLTMFAASIPMQTVSCSMKHHARVSLSNTSSWGHLFSESEEVKARVTLQGKCCVSGKKNVLGCLWFLDL